VSVEYYPKTCLPSSLSLNQAIHQKRAAFIPPVEEIGNRTASKGHHCLVGCFFILFSKRYTYLSFACQTQAGLLFHFHSKLSEICQELYQMKNFMNFKSNE